MTHYKAPNLRVYVVDDSEVDALIVKSMLKKIDIVEEVECCRDPSRALNYLTNPENSFVLPHVLILDIDMPTYDGFEFIMELQNAEMYEEEEMPFKIFFLTGSHYRRDMEKFLAQRTALEFLRKPFDIGAFEKTLEAHFTETLESK